jgi:hypothetical protein
MSSTTFLRVEGVERMRSLWIFRIRMFQGAKKHHERPQYRITPGVLEK